MIGGQAYGAPPPTADPLPPPALASLKGGSRQGRGGGCNAKAGFPITTIFSDERFQSGQGGGACLTPSSARHPAIHQYSASPAGRGQAATGCYGLLSRGIRGNRPPPGRGSATAMGRNCSTEDVGCRSSGQAQALQSAASGAPPPPPAQRPAGSTGKAMVLASLLLRPPSRFSLVLIPLTRSASLRPWVAC